MQVTIHDSDEPIMSAVNHMNSQWLVIQTINGRLTIFFPDGTDPKALEELASTFNRLQRPEPT